MEERIREDGFEATFVVATPRDTAWKWLASATPAAEWLPAPAPDQWWIPGVEGAADPLEVDEGRRFRGCKATFPCEGTEIVVTFEDEETGTRITFVQTGFGSDFDERRPWLASGWYAILADLVVFFDRGIALGRHLRPWASLGCDVTETPSGLVAGAVVPGGIAEQAGVEPGDLFVTILGAPVVTVRELSVLMRGSLRPGTEVRMRYLRGTEQHSGTGVT